MFPTSIALGGGMFEAKIFVGSYPLSVPALTSDVGFIQREGIMKVIIFCAAMFAAFCSTAEAASLQSRCAASTGAKSGPAFDACVSGGAAGGQNNSNQKSGLYKSPGTRGQCRMTGHC
jgi:hypothetical protein